MPVQVPVPTGDRIARALEFFKIDKNTYENWWNWYRKAGQDLTASRYPKHLEHCEICSCWLKEEPEFLRLDKDYRLMVFMCLEIPCVCVETGLINFDVIDRFYE